MKLTPRFLNIMPLLLIWGIFSCSTNETAQDSSTQLESSSIVLEEPEDPTPEPEKFNLEPEPISYYAWPNKVDSFQKALQQQFSYEELLIVWALNRVDEKNSWRPDTLMIPEQVNLSWITYSPFPKQLEILKSINKIVIFHYPLQVFAAYENGVLQYWGPTSMGSKAHPTPSGLHFANWKSKKSVSTVSDEWILPWNFNIANFEGVGWHEYSMPGYPASHSCLRLWSKDAQWLYEFAEQWILKNNQTKMAEGTPVIVHGAYPFGERRPWLNGLENPSSIILSVHQMEEIIQPHLSEIMKKQQERQDYLNKKNIEREDDAT